MKIAILVASATLLVGSLCAKQAPAQPPTPDQLAQIAKASAYTGTIDRAHLVLPMNHPSIRIEIVAADGTKAEFLITEDTFISNPDGTYEKYDLSRTAPIGFFHKKVEIRFAPITDTRIKTRVGKNGVLWIRFL